VRLISKTQNEKGAAVVEYGVLLSVIAALVIAIVVKFSPSVSAPLSDAATASADVSAAASGGSQNDSGSPAAGGGSGNGEEATPPTPPAVFSERFVMFRVATPDGQNFAWMTAPETAFPGFASGDVVPISISSAMSQHWGFNMAFGGDLRGACFALMHHRTSASQPVPDWLADDLRWFGWAGDRDVAWATWGPRISLSVARVASESLPVPVREFDNDFSGPAFVFWPTSFPPVMDFTCSITQPD